MKAVEEMTHNDVVASFFEHIRIIKMNALQDCKAIREIDVDTAQNFAEIDKIDDIIKIHIDMTEERMYIYVYNSKIADSVDSLLRTCYKSKRMDYEHYTRFRVVIYSYNYLLYALYLKIYCYFAFCD